LDNLREIGGNLPARFRTTEPGAPVPAQPAPESTKSVVSRHVLLGVLALAVLGYYGQHGIDKLKEYQKDKLKQARVQETLKEMKVKDLDKAADDVEDEPGVWGGRRLVGAADADEKLAEFDDEEERTSASDDDNDVLDRSDGYTQLILEVPNGTVHEAFVDLDQVDTMKHLQRLVVEEWEQAGGRRSDALMMEFSSEADGEWAPVTRSVNVETIKLSRQLRLSLKRKTSKPTGAKGYDRLHQEEHPPPRVCAGGRKPDRTSRGLRSK